MKTGLLLAALVFSAVATQPAMAGWRAGLDALAQENTKKAYEETISKARKGDAPSAWIAAVASMSSAFDGSAPLAEAMNARGEACKLLETAASQGFPMALQQMPACLVMANPGQFMTQGGMSQILAYRIAYHHQVPNDPDFDEEMADYGAGGDPAMMQAAEKLAADMIKDFKPVSKWKKQLSYIESLELDTEFDEEDDAEEIEVDAGEMLRFLGIE